MEKYILIVAGGKGLRMNSEIPKQLTEIKGKPLLMWTFEAFNFLKQKARFILVLNADLIGEWNRLCHEHHFNFHHEIVEGGPRRFHSVKRGLSLVPNNSVVAIHDSVRPLVSEKVIRESFAVAERKGNAIAAISINDSIRETDASINWSVDRNRYKIIQTPQTFVSDKIKRAYLQSYHEKFTDDASVLEATGEKINIVEGNHENIKITTPNDLVYAAALLNSDNIILD